MIAQALADPLGTCLVLMATTFCVAVTTFCVATLVIVVGAVRGDK